MSELAIEDRGPIRVLRFNRPTRMNALNLPMLEALSTALVEARTGGFRAIILTGAGKGFCAGAELDEYNVKKPEPPADDGSPGGPRVPLDRDAWWHELAQRLVLELYNIGIPTVAAINGAVAGSGLDLALACDFRVAAKSAKFHPAMRNLALCPDMGASWLMPRVVGPERTKRYYLLEKSWTAAQALEFGLVGEICEDDMLEATALGIAEALAQLPAMTVERTKRAINAGATLSLAQSQALEFEMAQLLTQTPDGAEAVESILSKRPPRFKHTW